jgi:hypothetical protein
MKNTGLCDENPAIKHLLAANERRAQEREIWLRSNEARPDWGQYASARNRLRKRVRKSTLTRHERELQDLTLAYCKANLFFDPGPGTTWRDYATEAAAYHAQLGLKHLQVLADAGNRKALAAIVELAVNATRITSEFSRLKPKVLRPIAEHCFLWPFLRARRERFGDNHKLLVKEIGLGEKVLFSEEALARIRGNKASFGIALLLLCRIEDYRRPLFHFGRASESAWQIAAAKLKPLSVRNWKRWFEVAWELLLAEHSGHPEKVPRLRKLGEYRSNHSVKEAAQTEVTAKTREANIRDGIREKLQNAVKRIARVPTKK